MEHRRDGLGGMREGGGGRVWDRFGCDVISFLLCFIVRGNHVRLMKEKGQATWERTEGEEERRKGVVALWLECWTGGGEEEREEEGEENGYRTVIAFQIGRASCRERV